MRILITGARGFTGRYLADRLHRAGHEVHSLEADITDAPRVIERLQQVRPEAIIHLAAVSFVPDSEGAQVYHVNVIGTENLLRAASELETPPSRIILASTSHVYGRNPAPAETDCPAPINHYGASKLAMEHLAATWSDRLDIVVTRPFTYTGVGQADRYLLPKLISHFKARSPRIEIGNRALARDFSDVRWIVVAYEALLTAPLKHSVYNLCSGASHTLEEILDILCEYTGHEPQVITNPRYVRANDILEQRGDNRRILTLPGVGSPIPLRETLKWMLDEDA
jgi:nucleoside-diphosphate-sugar epimerase